MPFNIELTKQSNAIIKIQSVKNTISIYIKGTSKAVELATLRNWQHLENHFINTMPEYHADWVRGPDAPHIKKNHTSSYEVTSTHYHSEFNTEITPGMFSFYLRNIFTQQLAHPSDEYQFFVNSAEVESIIETYAIYYREYKDSSTEEIYESETTLTSEEQQAYDAAVMDSKIHRSIGSLLPLIFLVGSGRHGIYRAPAAATLADKEDTLSLDDGKCSIM